MFESVFNSQYFSFQMLNCCIERKRLSKIRAASLQYLNNVDKTSETKTECNDSNSKNIHNSSSSAQMESLESQSSFSDDEEFFEAVESHDEAIDKDSEGKADDVKNTKRTDNDFNEDNIDNNTPMFRREGAKEPFGDLKLLVSGEPLLVPITQVCLFLTFLARISSLNLGMSGESNI